MACDEMRKRHFNDGINATRMKKLINVKSDVNVRMNIKEHNILHDSVKWRRLDNVQIKEAS